MTIAPGAVARSTGRSRRLAAGLAAVLVAAVPLLSGCFSGQGASTNTQSLTPSGDGASTTVGDLTLQNFTLVKLDGPDALLIGSVFNNGTVADTLLDVRVDGHAADIPDLVATIEPQSYRSFGYGGLGANGAVEGSAPVSAPAFYDSVFTGLVGTYVPLEITFENAGLVKMDVLVVPPTGYYAEVITPMWTE